MSLAALDEAIKAAGVPIDGVGRLLDGTVRIDFRPEATEQQRTQANAIAAGWDWSPAAAAAREDAKKPERTELRSAAVAAVAGNQDYLAIATPTTAQMRSQLAALTQQTNRVIRRLVQLD